MALEPSAILLTDRVVAVTGAARGIGRGIALAAARFGARLAICDRDGEPLGAVAAALGPAGVPPLSAVLDVRDGDAVRAFFADVKARFGRVDGLVNNAGGGFQASFLEVSERGQEALVRENFTSVTHCIRAAAPLMGAGGAIVNITSIEAHRAGPGFAIYSAMKAAVANLTRSLALEFGPRLIRVNCVAPDVIPTPGTGPIAVKTPLPRSGTVDDVAGAVLFLLSDLARFITGVTLHVDGGNWAAGGWRRSGDGYET
jgi:NAD(P)-dependent dehydrogenase (short-subunit alcohol dehydrogenase family)